MMVNTENNDKNMEEVVLNTRVSQYLLNQGADRKKKLRNVERNNEVLPKDEENQYTIHLNTVTYFILTQTMSVLGLKYGIKVRRVDVDLAGVNTQDLFEAIMVVGDVDQT